MKTKVKTKTKMRKKMIKTKLKKKMKTKTKTRIKKFPEETKYQIKERSTEVTAAPSEIPLHPEEEKDNTLTSGREKDNQLTSGGRRG